MRRSLRPILVHALAHWHGYGLYGLGGPARWPIKGRQVPTTKLDMWECHGRATGAPLALPIHCVDNDVSIYLPAPSWTTELFLNALHSRLNVSAIRILEAILVAG